MVIVVLPPGVVYAAGRPVASLASAHKVPVTPQPTSPGRHTGTIIPHSSLTCSFSRPQKLLGCDDQSLLSI